MSYTSKGIPWVLFLVLECTSREQARKVELHIKRMKSKQYIRNLKKYSEMRKVELHIKRMKSSQSSKV